MARKTKSAASRPLEKAYDNKEFLNSPAARNLRVLSEMMEPADRFRRYRVWDTVVFFGSARILPHRQAQKNLREIETALKKKQGKSKKLLTAREIAHRDVIMSRYYEDAAELAEKLTRWFLEVEDGRRFRVCTGGGPGIMEAANKGAKKAGGESVGLNISLPFEQEPNSFQTRDLSFEFHYFFIRKFWFFYLAKALVVFPGGFGTLDEFFELLTIIQTGKSRKHMPVILYGSEYWNDVLNLEAMAHWGTISRSDLELFRIMDDVDTAVAYLKEELWEYYIKPGNHLPRRS